MADGLFDDVLQPAASGGLFDDVLKPNDQGDVSRGFTRAFAQVPELAYGTGALAAMSAEKLFGEGGLSTAAKNYFGSKYAEKSAANQQYAPTVEFTDAWDAIGTNPGKMADWIQDSAGYVVGQGLQTIATGGIGALAGKMTLGSLVAGSAAKAADKLVAAEVAKRGLAGEAAEAAAAAMLPAATAQAARNLSTALGSGIVLTGQNLGMEAGDIYGGLLEESKKTGKPITGSDLIRAWGAAGLAAGTETVTDLLGLGALTGRIKIGNKAIQDMTGIGGRAARGAVGAGVGSVVEGGQEWVQTGLEQWGAGSPLDTPEAAKERINAAAVGALGGTIMGGGAGVLAPRVTVADIDKAPDLEAAVATAEAALDAPIDPLKDTIDAFRSEWDAQRVPADSAIQPIGVDLQGPPSPAPTIALPTDGAVPATEPIEVPRAPAGPALLALAEQLSVLPAGEQTKALMRLDPPMRQAVVKAMQPSGIITPTVLDAGQGQAGILTNEATMAASSVQPVGDAAVTNVPALTQRAAQELVRVSPGMEMRPHREVANRFEVVPIAGRPAQQGALVPPTLQPPLTQQQLADQESPTIPAAPAARPVVPSAPLTAEQKAANQAAADAERSSLPRRSIFRNSQLRSETGPDIKGEKVTRNMRRFLAQMGRLTGTKVVFEYAPEDSEGAVPIRGENVIHINTAAEINPMSIMGHEVTHVLKDRHREAWNAIRDALVATMPDKRKALEEFAKDYWYKHPDRIEAAAGIADWSQKLTPEQMTQFGSGENTIEAFLLDEMVSDLGGQHWVDEQFWTDTFAKIEAMHGDKAKGIIERLVAAIKESLAKALMLIRQQKQGDYSTISAEQLEKTRDAVTTAYAKFINEERTATPEHSPRTLDRRISTSDVTSRSQAGEPPAPATERQAAPDTDDFDDLEAAREAELARLTPRRPTSDNGHTRTKAGDYVGAPPGMTPAKLGRLRTILNKIVKEGEPGRHWYEESSKAILDASEGNVELAEKIAGLLAIYSPQMMVSGNTTVGLKALYQWMAGEPIKAKTGTQDRKAQAWMDGTMGESDALQIKTGNFFKNLMRKIDEERYGFEKQGATIDMWMARLFGYNSKSIGSSARYEFAEREVKKLAAELKWEPQQVQAALWVSIKSRVEAIADEAREIGKANGWLERKVTKSGAKENISWPPKPEFREDYESLILKMALGLDDKVAAAGVAKSKYNFGTALKERVGQISWEALPGRTTGLLPGVFNAPLEQQVEYLTAMDAALRDENGFDLIAKKLGLPVLSTAFGPSAWEGAVGVGAQTTLAVATDRDQANMKVTVSPAAKKLINAYAAIRGLVLHQEAVVWHYPIYDATKNNANGIEIDIGRDPTHDETVTLYRLISEKAGHTEWAPAYVPGVGWRIINFKDGISNKEFAKLIKSVLYSNEVPHSDVHTFASDGDYISNDWKENSDGQGYGSWISRAGSPDLQGWVESVLRPRTERVNREFADKYGWDQPNAASNGPSRESPVRSGDRPNYGTVRAGSVSAVGVHYSQQQRETLSSRFFGTGMKGEERARIMHSNDERIKRRLYFYTNEGAGITPESGVGSHAHSVLLNNLYDLDVDSDNLIRKSDPTKDWRDQPIAPSLLMNYTEAAVIDAGYDGYVTHQFGRGGAVVLLGDHSVPVRYEGLGTRPDVPVAEHAKPSDYKSAVARVTANKSLPSGQMSGADWKNLVPALMKGLDVSHLDDNEMYYKNQIVRKPDEAARRSESRPPSWYYSPLARAADAATMRSAPASGWKDWLKSLPAKGVKPDEIKWSGIEEWLDAQGKMQVTKEQVNAFLSEFGVKVETILRGERNPRNSKAVSQNVEDAEDENQPEFYFNDWETDEPDPQWIHERAAERLDEEMDSRVEANYQSKIRLIWDDILSSTGTVNDYMREARRDLGELFPSSDEDVTKLAQHRFAMQAAYNNWQSYADDPDVTFDTATEEEIETAMDRAFSVAMGDLAALEEEARRRARAELNEDEVLNDLAEQEERWYYDDSDPPQNREIDVVINGRTHTFYHRDGYGDQELYYDGNDIRLPRHADNADVQGAIREYLEENGMVKPSSLTGLKFVPTKWEGSSYNTDTSRAVSGSYREIQLTLPVGAFGQPATSMGYNVYDKDGELVLSSINEASAKKEADAIGGVVKPDNITTGREYATDFYYTTHWQEGNVVGFARFDERIDPDGKRVLMLQEVQGDWGQQRRKVLDAQEALPAAEAALAAAHKRYDEAITVMEDLLPDMAGIGRDEDLWRMAAQGVGITRAGMTDEQIAGFDELQAAYKLKEKLIKETRQIDAAASRPLHSPAPFVDKTVQWAGLILKRILAHAVEYGFDKVAWTSGAQQVERWAGGLRQNVDKIEWNKTEEGIHLIASKRGNEVANTNYAETVLSDALGKTMADRIINDPNQSGEITGNDITISDTGMAGFYEKMLPNIANEMLKKLDKTVRVGEVTVRPDGIGVTKELAKNSNGDNIWRVWQTEPNDGKYLVGNYYTEVEADAAVKHVRHLEDRAKATQIGTQLGFEITDKIRESAAAGIPLFSERRRASAERKADNRRAWYYSQLGAAVNDIPKKIRTGKEAAVWLQANASKLGIKKDELNWSGVLDYLQSQPTPAGVSDWLRDNGVKVKDVMLGEQSAEFDRLNEEYKVLDKKVETLRHAAIKGVKTGWRVATEATTIAENGEDSAQSRQMLSEIATSPEQLDVMLEYGRELVRKNKLYEKLLAAKGTNDTKFNRDGLTLPGGTNYRELLITLPAATGKDAYAQFIARMNDKYGTGHGDYEYDADETAEHNALVTGLQHGLDRTSLFTSTHFPQPNILAHLRFNERTDADGKRVLFIEEVQSDWAQKGRKEGFSIKRQANGLPEGFKVVKDGPNEFEVEGPDGDTYADIGKGPGKTEAEAIANALHNLKVLDERQGTPTAPFVTDTQVWTALALKRAIAYAVDNGFDRVAWTTGEQQNERYDLSKKIEQITVKKFHPNDKDYKLQVYTKAGRVEDERFDRYLPLDQLDDVIGKDAADKARKQVEETGSADLRGLDLKVGGEGMKGFYDQIVPQIARKLGAKLGTVEIVRDIPFTGKYELVELDDGTFGIKEKSTGYITDTTDSLVQAERALKYYADKEKEDIATRSFKKQQPGFDITDEMRQQARIGMPLFSTQRRTRPVDTSSPEFRKWFDGSKVVDADGKPLRVYHGTKGDIKKFAAKRIGLGSTMFGNYEVERHGIFVTPVSELANDFAMQGERHKREGANVLPLYASIKNPLDMTDGYNDNLFKRVEDWGNENGLDGYRTARDFGDNFGDWQLFDNDGGQDPELTIRMLKDLGYDGVKIHEPEVAGEGASGDTWVAFDPEQIKSAISNTGEFSRTDPNIQRSEQRRPSPELEAWLGKSVVRTPMYHGTARDITTFRPQQADAIFLTDNPKFAGDFSDLSRGWMLRNYWTWMTPEQIAEAKQRARESLPPTGREREREMLRIDQSEGHSPYLTKQIELLMPSESNIMPLYVRAENPFDYRNPAHVAAIEAELGPSWSGHEFINGEMFEVAQHIGDLERGDWNAIESPQVQEYIRKNHDSFYVRERGVTNLAVFSPNQVKSASGNSGTYSREDNDIRYSLPRGYVGPRTAEEMQLQKDYADAQSRWSAAWSAAVSKAVDKELEHMPEDTRAIFKESVSFRGLAYERLVKEGVPAADKIEQEMQAINKKIAALIDKRVGPPEYEGVQQLDKMARPLVNSAAFRNWFADSKVVSPTTGLPLIVLHGTTFDITKFETVQQMGSKRLSQNNWLGQLGSWFAGEGHPGSYEEGNAESVADTFAEKRDGERGVVYPVFLSIQNPMEYEGYEDLLDARDDAGSGAKLRKQLIDAGYDGLVVRESTTDGDAYRDDWVAFYPMQIKSAIGNDGSYSREDNDIRRSERRATWTPERIDRLMRKYAYTMDDSRTKAFAAWIDPEDFLRMTSDHEDRARIEREAGELDEEALRENDQELFLEVNDITASMVRVEGHEGRHRATALINAGISKMPVVLWLRNGAMRDAESAKSLYLAPQKFGREAHQKAIGGGFVTDLTPISYEYQQQLSDTFGGDGDVRFSTPRSRITGQPINQTWTDPDVTDWDDLVRKMQDDKIDTKRVLRAIRDAGVAVKEKFDAYMLETNYHGRAASRVDAFADGELRKLLEDMAMRKLSMEDLDDYLWARHAPERNAANRRSNPQITDGSGMSDAQAADILAGRAVTINGRTIQLSAASIRSAAAVAGRVDAITNGTLDLLVQYGLETQQTVDTWRRTYGSYVPLKRDMESDANYSGAFGLGNGTGSGFSVRGAASKRAMGSKRTAIDILANVAMQRERAITRGEKNRVAQGVYGLALSAPNPEFWIPLNTELNKKLSPAALAKVVAELVALGVNPIDAQNLATEPVQRYIDPKTGLEAQRINPALRGREDVLSTRINGEDRYVMFSNKKRAQEMVRGLKNLDAASISGALQVIAPVTRWFAAVNTQFNPVFGLTNGVRDFSTGMLNLSSTPLAGKRAEVASHAWKALIGVYADLRAHRAGRPATSQYAQLFEQFALDGGQTGYRDAFATSADRAEAIAKELKHAGKGQEWLAVGEKRSHIFGWLSDYNTAVENAMRLSAYKVALDDGMSRDAAASLAKNLTVNFNKKGLAATQTGALYAFFNAAVQGTARIGQTMTTDGKLNAVGQKIVYGGMMLGVLQAVMGALAGWDDDEPPQFSREKNFIIPVPGSDKYVSIPMPLGFHVIPNIGRITAEWMLGGFKDPGKRLVRLAGVVLDAFNPIGSGTLAQTLSPTIGDPIIALAENKDWTGKSIYKEDFNKMHPTPGWTRSKDSASPPSRWMSRAINYVTGGGQYEIGMWSPTPDTLDYLVGQATGGTGREVLKTLQYANAKVTGEELPIYKTPLGVGRFVGETKGQSSETSKFYRNLERIGEHKSALEEMKDARDSAALQAYLTAHPEARLVQMADKAQREIGYLRRQKRELIEKGANRERIKMMDDKITGLTKRYNEILTSR